MKLHINYLITLFLLILLQSCYTIPNYYYSNVDVPYYSKAIKTEFTLIKDDSISAKFAFGVISAIENDTLAYVILAPQRNIIKTRLDDFNLTNSIPLLKNHAKEFIKILKTSAEKWDTKYESDKGINLEFHIAAKDDIIQGYMTETVWHPTLSFIFQNNGNRRKAKMVIGNKFVFDFRSKMQIVDLYKLLEIAISI